MTDTILTLTNISKSFDMGKFNVNVLQNVNLSIRKSEFFSITGPSGAGKSTLMHIMAGLEKPSGGQVFYGVQDVYKLSGNSLNRFRNNNIGFVFQFHYLLDDFTAVENVMIPALLGGAPREKAKERAAALLNEIGLDGRHEHLPKELSGGEQQRVAIARALVNSPSLLFADEPTGNLDKANSETVQNILFSLPQKGISVALVTHDIELAEKADTRFHLEKV